ncbi:PEP-CTERM sorting domain-containing protein [Qipengyuania sp. JC766]|uniref:PEP-CTERM sorting domain-containing protein n=1 Tax=Qipengyuania sp. JC766 TaxID=3232139 RepID=UPI0034590F76
METGAVWQILASAAATPTAGTAIPEPSNLALFGLGLLGLLVGRQVAKRRSDKD